ncbi:thiamine pyrophosphate-binding protein [Xenorhabdus bovienii]|uniref:thiamine pyrophosphate-binding protein n=2 Tax=Xenorhabdus bovienii TaxID=40576 RepID=UPI0023B2131E|nr:thiamine pyrophosphate-binding protein [Xenorhabdus bovienii]MDE9459550.1 thiamine pyrophosphate-binding protein [Xenorhabdus bovienii]MDE9487895.1 thiamine pyrophosphate-binding protein [Xenorhabdus bovienii]MDE9515830.1 thiamine pyrophosphate-binding protein [Xenorhabdus bovienii]
MKFDELFLRTLVNQGVTKCFGIVGGEAEAIRFSNQIGIEFFLTRHEFTAGIMADVFGRFTGKPQMCWSTFGPGLTNMATGVCSGILDRSPMIAASAQIPREQIKYNLTHQCIDNVSFMEPITKLSFQIENIQDIRQKIPSAIKKAVDELPGPVYMSIPVDILKQEVSAQEAAYILEGLQVPKRTEPVAPIEDDLNKAAQLVNNSCYPMIVIGNQVLREQIQNEVRLFAEKLNAPIICSLAAKGAIPEQHYLFLTAANKYLDGVYRQPVVSDLFHDVDLLILIGYDFGEDLKPSLWGHDKDTIVINSFDIPTGDIFQPKINCLGNIKESLHYLSNFCPTKKQIFSPKHQYLKMLFDKRSAIDVKPGTTDIPKIIEIISNYLGESGILCSDVGMHKQYAGLLARTQMPNRFICSNICGSFGFGLPAALAAKLCNPEEKVLAICGDGGFHSTSQDLETAVRYNLPVIIIVLSDSAFGLIKYYQGLHSEKPVKGMTELGLVQFHLLANANGMKSAFIDNLEELPKVLEQASLLNEPFLIEIPVTYDYDLLKHIS